jgi:hypothetical protein
LELELELESISESELELEFGGVRAQGETETFNKGVEAADRSVRPFRLSVHFSSLCFKL